MKPKKKVNHMIETLSLDKETGEVVQETQVSSWVLDREPDFVKLYVDDIGSLFNLSNTDILFAFVRKMNYDNEIALNASIKRDISKTLKTTVSNIDKMISKYVKEDILIRKDRGLFLVNPYIFGRGKWQDIRKIRLSIEYTLSGRKIVSAIEKQEPEEEQWNHYHAKSVRF